MLIAYVDGGIAPRNPGGIASCGVIVFDDRGQRKWVCSEVIGEGDSFSNNVSEYMALVKLLEWLELQENDEVIVNSDSALLVNQINNKWRVSSDKLYYPAFVKANDLMIKTAHKVTVTQIHREKNLADNFSTKAREEYLAKVK